MHIAESGRIRKYLIGPLFATIAGLCGCDTLGSIDERAQTFNKASADYAAAAILYNILRAKEAEPLHFVSLTGVVGHNTLTASLGLPTFEFGPDKTETQRLFLLGPTLVGGTNSNDFNINIIDDPKSYAALLTPVDPGTMGFLINSGYEQARVLFLFVSRIQVFRNDLKVDDVNGELLSEANHKYVFDKIHYPLFYNRLITYIDQGLSVKVDPTFVPGNGNASHASFCFDEAWVDTSVYPRLSDRAKINNACFNTLQKESNQKDKKPIEMPSVVMQTTPKGQNGRSPDKLVAQFDPTSTALQKAPSKDVYRFTDQTGDTVELQTRSVYGAYRYLGEILRIRQELTKLLQTQGDLGRFREIFTGYPVDDILYLDNNASGCWASVAYAGDQWCVPASALGTKRTFAILHTLFQLYTAPNNQPNTPTVRVTPG